MESPPTIAEELDRKTIDTLQQTMHDHAVSKISTVAAHAAVATLWGMTAGLVPRDTMNLVGQAQTHLGQHLTDTPQQTCVFGNVGAVAVVQRFADKVFVRTLIGEKTMTPPADAVHPGMWAVDKFNECCVTFQGRGLQRII